MTTWGSAQWVLVTLLAVGSLLPIGAHLAGFTKHSSYDFAITYAARMIMITGFVCLLWWGGFWS